MVFAAECQSGLILFLMLQLRRQEGTVEYERVEGWNLETAFGQFEDFKPDLLKFFAESEGFQTDS